MGYRLFIVICALVLVSACSAMDHDSQVISGGPSGSVSKGEGAFSGYYAGVMKLDSNVCQSVSDELGTESEISMDVTSQDKDLNIVFEDGTDASGKIEDSGKSVVMTDVSGINHVFYLTFSEDGNEITGSCDVLEQDDNGQYSDPCASYTMSLKKGERPVVALDGEDDGDSEQGEEVASPPAK